ncbi:MAG: hypothetical protein GY874_03145 [Desulfobacteraceae bacterium]|nr:hypothetical protein [Desulfobacteraceae bacterium]
MAGKITTVLVRKEAEAYNSQGLHKEAIDLYGKLLETTPNIDPDLKNIIENRIKGITEEMKGFEAQRSKALTAYEINKIRQGWGDRASEEELLVCAKAMSQMGAYDEAMVEFESLLYRGADMAVIAGPITNCMVHLHDDANKFNDALKTLIGKARLNDKKALLLKLAVSKELLRENHKAHVVKLYSQLQNNPLLSVDKALQIKEFLGKYHFVQTDEKSEPKKEKVVKIRIVEDNPPKSFNKIKSIFILFQNRLLSFFNFFKNRHCNFDSKR